MAEGVAHAPLVTDSDVDTGTDEDTRGTERRPTTPRKCNTISEFGSRDALAASTASCVSRPANGVGAGGNGAPAFVFPPPSLRFRGCEGLQRRRSPSI
jgi:hypothetical protein